jgi:HSP20 family protein
MYLNVYRPSVIQRQRVNGQAYNGLIDSVFNDVFGAEATTDNNASVTAHARFDVVERADGYEAFIEIPGVAKEDIEINIEGTKVSVKAEAKRDAGKAEGERVIVQQRRATKYLRSFELPLEVADERAEASYENGVLKLVLPKKEVAQPKRLAIK